MSGELGDAYKDVPEGKFQESIHITEPLEYPTLDRQENLSIADGEHISTDPSHPYKGRILRAKKEISPELQERYTKEVKVGSADFLVGEIVEGGLRKIVPQIDYNANHRLTKRVLNQEKEASLKDQYRIAASYYFWSMASPSDVDPEQIYVPESAQQIRNSVYKEMLTQIRENIRPVFQFLNVTSSDVAMGSDGIGTNYFYMPGDQEWLHEWVDFFNQNPNIRTRIATEIEHDRQPSAPETRKSIILDWLDYKRASIQGAIKKKKSTVVTWLDPPKIDQIDKKK